MKRLHLFCGHYGSGKTNLAVNFALRLAAEGHAVTLADLDIVNPYFRSKDSEAELAAAGVRLIALPFAGSNVDLPALPPEAYTLVQDRSRLGVLDIGGDDRGAYALGRYRREILEENDFENIFVVNFLRPLTTTVEEALEVLREIEQVSGLPFTAIVNNTNLGPETTAAHVLEGEKKALELGKRTGLRLLFTGISCSLSGELENSLSAVLPMKLQKKPTEL